MLDLRRAAGAEQDILDLAEHFALPVATGFFDYGSFPVRHAHYIGQVENLYVDDDRNLHFVDVVTSGFLGLGKKHHLVPVEAIAEEAPGSITLTVDQQTV